MNCLFQYVGSTHLQWASKTQKRLSSSFGSESLTTCTIIGYFILFYFHILLFVLLLYFILNFVFYFHIILFVYSLLLYFIIIFIFLISTSYLIFYSYFIDLLTPYRSSECILKTLNCCKIIINMLTEINW